MSLTEAEYRRFANNFVNSSTREIIADPQTNILVCVGDWPTGNVGDRQSKCNFCADLVGVSPKGWAIHQRAPLLNPLCCPFCRDVLWAIGDHCTKSGIVGDLCDIGWDNAGRMMVLWLLDERDRLVELVRELMKRTVQ